MCNATFHVPVLDRSTCHNCSIFARVFVNSFRYNSNKALPTATDNFLSCPSPCPCAFPSPGPCACRLHLATTTASRSKVR